MGCLLSGHPIDMPSQKGWTQAKDPPPNLLSINIFNPSHGLNVADRSKVPLGGRKIRMAEDDLADNFNGHAWSGCIGSWMPAQIMRPKVNADHITGFDDHRPCRLICYRKNAVVGWLAFFGCINAEPVRHFLGDENDLLLLAAFGFPKDQLSFIDILQSELEHLPDTHPTAGHQF